MKNLIRGKMCLLAGVVCASASLSLSAATIFDNSSTFEGAFLQPDLNTEIGDQVIFAKNGVLANYRMIQSFEFQYWSFSPDANWNVEARIKFRANDGAPFNGYASPSSVLWDSDWFSLPKNNDYKTLLFTTGGLDFPSGGVQAPQNEMTWTIEFKGADVNDQYGVALFTSPTVGNDYTDYWQFIAGSWQLATNSMVSDMSFGAVIGATIPEPSSVTLSILGGLGLLAWTRRMRNQK